MILLGGGFKKRQGKDIEAAKAVWADYKMRKRKQKQSAETKVKEVRRD